MYHPAMARYGMEVPPVPMGAQRYVGVPRHPMEEEYSRMNPYGNRMGMNDAAIPSNPYQEMGASEELNPYNQMGLEDEMGLRINPMDERELLAYRGIGNQQPQQPVSMSGLDSSLEEQISLILPLLKQILINQHQMMGV